MISGSAGDLQPVFAAMLENAVRICDATFGTIYRWDGDSCTHSRHTKREQRLPRLAGAPIRPGRTWCAPMPPRDPTSFFVCVLNGRAKMRRALPQSDRPSG